MRHARSIPSVGLLLVLACGTAAWGQVSALGGKPLVGADGKPIGKAKLEQPVTISAKIIAASKDKPAQLSITARIDPGWHIYSLTQKPGGPIRTTIEVKNSPDYKLIGKFEALKPPATQDDPNFKGIPLETHEVEVTWQAPIELKAGLKPDSVALTGEVAVQACNDKQCLPPKKIAFKTGAAPAKAQSGAKPGGNDKAETDPNRPGEAEAFQAPLSHAQIVGRLEPQSVAPGGTARLTLAVTPTSGFHVYALADRDPENVSKPTLIVLTPSAGLAFGPISPSAEPITGRLGVDTASYYTSPVTWTTEIQVAKDARSGEYPVSGIIGYQTCSDTACDPPKAARFEATLLVGEGPAAAPSASLQFTAAKYGEAAQASVAAKAATQDLDRFVLSQQAAAEPSLWLIVGFALLGGVILNLMPCVLPVIGLKILSFVEQSNHDRKRIFWLNLWYTVGLMSVFMILATLPVVSQLVWKQRFIWGQQFGNDAFNITMASVLFAMGLSLLGVWDIPIPGFLGTGRSTQLAAREGAIGAFSKGVVTTLLATPCSGPFLGTALGWALRQPPQVIYLVFAAIGLGMASPYLVIGVFPRLIRWLPKPGAWMDTFKQLMGFLLLGTVVYLLTFIGWTYVVPTVAFLIGLWAACWWIGRTPLTADLAVRARAWGLAIAFAVGMGFLSFDWLSSEMASRFDRMLTQQIASRMNGSALAPAAQQGEHDLGWQPFSREILHRETNLGKTVMVDFTADWCPNCKALEKFVLNTPEVKQLVQTNGVVALVADYTKFPPEIGEMIDALGGASVPLLAIFPAGTPHEPIVFLDGYSPQKLLEALRKAGPSVTAATGQANVVAGMPGS